MLTEQEMDQLKALLDRAIAYMQVQIGVISPFVFPDVDLLGEVDRHDGNCASSSDWITFSMRSEDEYGIKMPHLKILVDQKSLDFVTNGVQE